MSPVVAAAAASLALFAFAAHIWQGISGVYLNHVSGIWLALGRDLAAGLFYRHLISPIGYGGTRYFPLFFTIIGGLLRIGVSPLTAGWTASALAAIVLSTGLARIGRALGAPRSMVWLLGAAAIAPYFVQQTVLEVRADVLAVGLNSWGLASIISIWRDATDDRRHVVAATTWFVLAFAAKITSLAVPVSVVVALVLSGRARAGVRFALGLAAGLGLFFVIVQLASDGRALESWRACMFAGSTEGGTLSAMMTGDFLGLVSFSRLLAALFVLDLVALAALVIPAWTARGRAAPAETDWRAGSAIWLPVVLFAGVTASTALTLSSPGTVPSNQVLEWLEMSLVVIVWAAASRKAVTRVGSFAIAALVVWMGVQDLVRVRALWETRSERTSVAVRNEVVRFVGSAPTPVLAESSLWPVLAGHQAYLLDPFALRVVMGSHPEIARDLEKKIDAQYFSSVIFQVDPTSAAGRGYYAQLHFGWPITARILDHYRFDRHPAADVWIYVPKDPGH